MVHWQVETIQNGGRIPVGAAREVWSKDPLQSAFSCPMFLDASVSEAAAAGSTTILSTGISDGGGVVALWPLRLDAKGGLQFLQPIGGDHYTCLTAPELPVEELADGFAEALRVVRPRRVYLQRIPPVHVTAEAARLGLRKAGWKDRMFAATPCPVLTVAPGPDASEQFRKQIEQHKRIKNYQNRLQREPGYAFEAFEDLGELEPWAADFCDAHEMHWNRTATPSMYRSPAMRETFVQHLRAWHADGVLVRFSIRLAAGRAGFVVGLSCRDRLIYHHVVVSPFFEEHRAGHVLIRLIGLWMAQRGYRTLDFGVGDESYKLRYANADEKLLRVYGSPRAVSRAYVSGAIDQAIRDSSRLQNLWDTWINRRVRGRLKHFARCLKHEFRVLRRVHLTMPLSTRVALLQGRYFVERQIFYHGLAGGGPKDPDVRIPETADVLRLLEDETGLRPRGRVKVMEHRLGGATPYGIYEQDKLVQVSWLSRATEDCIPEWLDVKGKRVWTITSCVTVRSARGRGLYTRVLKAIMADLPPGDPVVIYTHLWNHASRRGILKAGFQPLAIRTIWKRSGRRVFEPISTEPSAKG